jgi:hypothetical protein
MISRRNLLTVIILVMTLSLNAQTSKEVPDLSGFGKMWAMEHLPMNYFMEKYQFAPDEEWLNKVRLSSLQFATYCSASFISPDGLILTNDHCARGSETEKGENFDATGFYAATLEEEQPIPGLFVRQLAKIKDISDEIDAEVKKFGSEAEKDSVRNATVGTIIAKYAETEEWKGLEIEPVFYYSGLKVSLYGYKKYSDIRLVCLPEVGMGFFGGDPDNFAYPRYSLDFTIFRAYENGKPVNSSAFYFPININGAEENELVFVTGHPGSTERYRTIAQYAFDRDYRYKALNAFLKDRYDILKRQYEKSNDRRLGDQLFMISNSLEAFGGILSGLNNPELMKRKQVVEDYLRKAVLSKKGTEDYWALLASQYKAMGPVYPEFQFFTPSRFSGATIRTLFAIHDYISALKEDSVPDNAEKIRSGLIANSAALGAPIEKEYLAAIFREMKNFADPGDTYVSDILKNETPDAAANRILSSTLFADSLKLQKFLDKKVKRIENSSDPLVELSQIIVPLYYNAQKKLIEGSAERAILENTISKKMFEVFGYSLTPDATFTLRLQEGIVKGYEYNGTVAPYKTTFYGMYDRYYSFDKKDPFSLPERWQNPPREMLPIPFNFVASTDVIGGNSGSPMINKNRELVGLVFDGNVESLPGNFIFDEQYNRTVALHTAGLAAALKYIYKADRLLKELGVQ